MAKNQTPSGTLMDKLTALCKRRGIVFPSSEIYGGVGSTYDYGPPGVEIKNNIARLWWKEMTLQHDEIVGLDSAIILHPKVWETSGHVKEFHDPMVECTNCRRRIRLDDYASECYQIFMAQSRRIANAFEPGEVISPSVLAEDSPERKIWEKLLGLVEFQNATGIRFTNAEANALIIEYVLNHHNQCSSCGAKNSLLPPRQFNLMLKTHIGPIEDDSSLAYFRPETAQGIYLDYKIVQETSRLKIPFGIAQIGKAFRNEITTQRFIFRTREFEQMEMQYFVKPGTTADWLEKWKERRWNWYLSLGINPARLRWHQHEPEKRAHYAQDAWDIEYEFPFGWSELEGVHDRGGFDLTAHAQATEPDKEPNESKLAYFDDETRERFIPHIVETSAGLNRTMLMVLCDAYREDVQAGEERVYLALHPKIAPTKAAIFPLVKKDGIADISRDIYQSLKGKWQVFYDEQGSIGKRYRRQDELGTPFCFTIDYQTKEDGTVTVRWRDTLKQERIAKDSIADYLTGQLGHRQ